MSFTHNYTGTDDAAAARKVNGLLASNPAYQYLNEPARRDLAAAMAKVAAYLGNDAGAVARQMAPDLMSTIGTRGSPQQPIGEPTPAPPAPATGTTPAQTGPTGRVGDVTRATLAAIDFPSFVASLIKGTFQAIVDASIQQMEAYAELLKNCATTVDRFMQDNVSDGNARDYLADQYPNVLGRDTSGGQARLVPLRNRQTKDEIPSFFKDLGFNSPSDIDDDSIEQVIVPSAKQYLAESRQRTLATMVLMGINRVVVDDGEIQAKLQFHIDASEAMQMRFDQNKVTTGSMMTQAGRSPFSAQAVMVNTASLNAQTDLNVRADLTGQVRVKFRSETFPLERFADSAAIQLINNNARVPGAQAAPGTATAPGTAPVAGAPAAKAPPPPPLPPNPAAPASQRPAAQALEEGDPWAPED